MNVDIALLANDEARLAVKSGERLVAVIFYAGIKGSGEIIIRLSVDIFSRLAIRFTQTCVNFPIIVLQGLCLGVGIDRIGKFTEFEESLTEFEPRFKVLWL